MAVDIKFKAPNPLAIKIAERFGLSALGVFVIALILGYLFLFAPGLRRAHQADKTGQISQELSAKREYLTELQALIANYQKIPADDVEKIRSMIPFEDDLPGLTAVIEALAKANDVELVSIGLAGGIGEGASAVSAETGLKTISINMSLQHADYRRIKLFIESIERHLRIFDIQSMNLNPASAQYVMSITTYVHAPIGS